MEIIIASDIFGKTPELEEIAAYLSTDAVKVAIVDPYDGNHLKFRDENEAYLYFQQNVGLEQYKDLCAALIEKSDSDLFLIGFSIGASAIWAISDKFGGETNIKATCFYGSQIRAFPDVNPAIPVELIFPKHEPHFNVDHLIDLISFKNNVRCHTVPYLHGFMNRISVNFNKSAFDKYLNHIYQAP